MSQTFFVGVRGESFDNPDGTSRQEIIRTLRAGDAVDLIPDPSNQHDRWAVGVFTKDGKQIGFLPSDARDSSALLRGEPVKASIAKLTGGTNWLARAIQGKKHIGVVLSMTKGEPDWSRYTKLADMAKPFDDAVLAAKNIEKAGEVKDAILAYRKVIADIADFTENDKYASAHRRESSPVDRLSLLLEKQKNFTDALNVINDWLNRFDPIQPPESTRKSVIRRKQRLQSKLR